MIAKTHTLAILLLLSLVIQPMFFANAQANTEVETYTGTISASNSSKNYFVHLQEGDAILVTAEALSGNLDTYIYLYSPDDDLVSSNDDRSPDNYDSALGYIALMSGAYRVRVSHYPQAVSSGDYRVTMTYGDISVLDELSSITRIQLSGEMLTRDTENFRIHYTLEGEDATTVEYVEAVAQAVEDIHEIEIVQLGWAAPPSDGVMGGNDKFDFYILNLTDALGYASPESIIGDNPNTEHIEEPRAATSYLQIDNDFSDATNSQAEAIALMRATVAHEFHHAIQFGYNVDDAHDWYYEATATWMETQAAGADQDATGYIAYAYDYPELCFGTTSDPGDGTLQYGEWTFLQFLQDEYGVDAPRILWEQIALYEGFESIELTIEPFGDDLPTLLARYRAKNLVRDYELAPLFEATVWMEERINDTGRWTYTGAGIQELGANYFGLDVADGTYYTGVTNDGGHLNLWAIGITGDEAHIRSLGRGGIIDTTPYDHTYLMVFNPVYDEDVNDCTYYDYQVDVIVGKGNIGDIDRTWSAEHFEALY